MTLGPVADRSRHEKLAPQVVSAKIYIHVDRYYIYIHIDIDIYIYIHIYSFMHIYVYTDIHITYYNYKN